MVASRFAVLGALLLACGSSSGGFRETASDAGPSDGTTSNDGTMNGDDGGSLLGDGGGDASSSFGCSASVLDQPPDEGAHALAVQ